MITRNVAASYFLDRQLLQMADSLLHSISAVANLAEMLLRDNKTKGQVELRISDLRKLDRVLPAYREPLNSILGSH